MLAQAKAYETGPKPTGIGAAISAAMPECPPHEEAEPFTPLVRKDASGR
jgi:hypothetical protein